MPRKTTTRRTSARKEDPGAKPILSLLSDQPLHEGDPQKVDGLGFEPYASVLAAAARGTRGPFTIGVHGAWGTGKTSLMRMIRRQLENDADTVLVWFNAWMHEREEHPIVPLVAAVAQAAVAADDGRGTTGKWRKLGSALQAVAFGFTFGADVGLPAIGNVRINFDPKRMADRYRMLSAKRLQVQSIHLEAFDQLDHIVRSEKFKVVVFVDDLDRCFPSRAVELLESIKLVLSQPGFVFLLGVDDGLVQEYIQHKYREEYGVGGDYGAHYLRKLIQLPFPIPPHSSRIEDYSHSLVENLNRVGIGSDVQGGLDAVVPIVVLACAGRPRAVVRIINNLLIDDAINKAQVAAEREEDGSNKRFRDIAMKYFAVERCMQHAWPAAYRALAGSETLCDKVRGILSSAKEVDLKEAVASTDPVLRSAVTASPCLVEFLAHSHARAWLDSPADRSAAREFLRLQRDTHPLPERYLGLDLLHEPDDVAAAARLARMLARHGYYQARLVPTDSTDTDGNDLLGVCLGPRSVRADGLTAYIGVYQEQTHGDGFFILLPGSAKRMLPDDEEVVFDLSEGITEDTVAPIAEHLQQTSRQRQLDALLDSPST